jgi:hypothetical protein
MSRNIDRRSWRCQHASTWPVVKYLVGRIRWNRGISFLAYREYLSAPESHLVVGLIKESTR